MRAKKGSVIDRIESLIAAPLDAMGYDLWRLQLSGAGGRQTLQIMAERRDRRAMTVEDCAEISRALSALLDVDDPIPGAYTLEVSSPGIDRPLVRPDHFERFAGHVAKLEAERPIDGRKRFRGRIGGVSGEAVRVELDDGGAVEVPFADIHRAKLVLTNELLATAEGEARELRGQG